MKYKKILVIMLVSVLICTSVSAVAMARTSSETKEIRSSAFLGKLSELFQKFFKSIPTLSSFLMRRAPPELSDPAPGTPETPQQPPQQPINLVFQIYITNECGEERKEFKLDEIIYVTATITNEGKTAVVLEAMDVQFGTLDYFIMTPEGCHIHYVGVLPIFPTTELIKPGETYTSKTIALNDKGDNVHFGIIPAVDSAVSAKPVLYEDFVKGEYTIWGQYVSNLNPIYVPPLSSLANEQLVFNGQLKSKEDGFAILD